MLAAFKGIARKQRSKGVAETLEQWLRVKRGGKTEGMGKQRVLRGTRVGRKGAMEKEKKHDPCILHQGWLVK